MMKKNQRRELLVNIRHTIYSFLSITIFIALGLALFFTLNWSAGSIRSQQENSYENTRGSDLTAVFPLGIRDETLNDLKASISRGELETMLVFHANYKQNGSEKQARIHTLTEHIDVPLLIEGRLPEKEGEIVVEKGCASKLQISIGDSFSFTVRDGILPLKTDAYTVVGIAESSRYLSKTESTYGQNDANGTEINALFFVSREEINAGAAPFDNMALLRFDSARGLKSDSEAYEQEVNDAAEKLDLSNAVVEKRFGNRAYIYIDLLTSNVENVRFSIGGVFLVIAVMICFCIITRLVNDQSKEIGTKKALGFTEREITLSYLCYGLAAAVIGSVLGFVLALFAFEPVMVHQISTVFVFEENRRYFEIWSYLRACAVILILIGLVSYLGCRKNLKRSAVDLLTGKNEQIGKKHFFQRGKLWNNASVLTKSIISNCVSEKQRVIPTLIGIISCTAMIVSGIMMKNDTLSSVEKQFTEYYQYDYFVTFDPETDGAVDAISSVLTDMGLLSTPVMRQNASVSVDGKFDDFWARILAFENEQSFCEMYHLKSVHDDSLDSQYVWLSDAPYYYYHLGDDSVLHIKTDKGKENDLKNVRYYQHHNYIANLILSAEMYEQLFDDPYAANTIVVKNDGYTIGEITERLSSIEGFFSVTDSKAASKMESQTFSVISNAIVGIYLFGTVLLGFFVILNLLLTFVEEKRRELITLMINGYSRKDTRKYISTDTMFLTTVGIILGGFWGILLGNLNLAAMESAYFHVSHAIDPASIVIGVLFSSSITAIMTMIAIRKINQFELKDINVI